MSYYYILFLYLLLFVVLSRTIRVDELGGRAFFTYPKDRFKLLNVQPSVTCENITVSVKNTTNYNSPITVSLSYQLVNQQNKRETVYISDKHVNGVDKFCARCPVLDKYRSSPPSLFEVPISLGCGPDNICQSVLSIDAIFPDLGSDNTFVVGSQNQLNLQAKIKNSGENAYSTQLAIILPDSIHFRQFPTECEEKNISTIICNVGNPLRNNSESSLVVNLDMKKINKDINHSEIIIILKLLTLSVNSNPSERNFTIGLRREADIMISGKSGQQSVPFNRSTDAMLNFSQIYQVEKIGASPLEKVQINISLPLSVRIGSKEVKFIKVYPPDGIFAGQSIDCRSDIEYVIETNEMSEDVESDVVSSRSRRQAVGKNENSRDLITETKGNSLGHNRTVYLNCSVEDIVCYSIVCTAGPFEKKQTPATIEIRMMLDPSPISHLIEEKYVIIYSTQGSVLIQVPAQFIQNGNRPDFVEISNLFINETIKKKNIALWIIILAAVIGILLLVLIILGLVKLGFFKRTKKEELENLKAMAEQIATEPAPHDPDQVESPSLQIVEEYEQEETKEIK